MIDLSLKYPGSKNYKVQEIFKCDGRTYEIGDFINSGGNAVVHKCNDATTGDEVAIKIQLKTHGVRLKRFEREKKISSSCSHDHLIKYIGEGEFESELRYRGKTQTLNLPYILMELGEKNLSQYLKELYDQSASVKPENYIAQFRGLANALSELHKIALHRDIKPTNILITGDKWQLSDYGLCALLNTADDDELTRVGEVIGPQNWMSPEANKLFCGINEDITTASDVYQLAAVFWLVVNNRHPTGIVTKDDWNGPDNLFSILIKALQHDPGRRPQNGSDFAAAISASILS